jgi:hypothetical protein
VVLRGTISGTNSGVWEELPRTDYDGHVSMDVTFVLEEHRARVTGTADIAGEYTGDCAFSDSTSIPFSWDSQPDPDWTFVPQEGRPAFVSLQVYMSDPRYAERPMSGMYLSVGAGGGAEGGTCGYRTGRTYPISDLGRSLRVDITGCSFFEVLNAVGAWHGQCDEEDPSGGRISRSWTADLAQVQG